MENEKINRGISNFIDDIFNKENNKNKVSFFIDSIFDNSKKTIKNENEVVLNETEINYPLQIISQGNDLNKNYDSSKIIKIQGEWRMKRNSKSKTSFSDRVLTIQRYFRKFLLRKYDLPENYFYNAEYFKIQKHKYDTNLLDNLKTIFPLSFSINNAELRPSSKSLKKAKSCIINKESSQKNNSAFIYEEDKIHLFSQILDIDIIIETDDVYDNLWATSYDNIKKHCVKSTSPIQLLSLGSSHTVCVNSKGRVFSYGWNNYGQCGVPVNSTIIAKEEIDNDFLIEMTEYNHLKPRVLNKVDGIKVPQIEEVIQTKSITCGEDHTLILDHNGALWGFGLNLNGQLGLGHKKFIEKPTKIEILKNIVSVKSEGNINFAANNQGDCFMWPWGNKDGQIYLNPIKLSLNYPNEKVVSISCGNNFVILLNNNGMLYSMGKNNKYGQLGHGDVIPKYRPKMIDYFKVNSERISQVSCGFKHCIAKAVTGHVFTWGLGVNGQLGHKDFNNYTNPYQLHVESQYSKIVQISAGFRSSYFMTENRKIYYCGSNGSTSMQNCPVLHNMTEKIPDFDGSNYSPVRILNTWNKSLSIFYATIADISSVNKVNVLKINQVLNYLSSKWENENVDPPYIDTISKYFPVSVMKKLKK